jgi:hypothetical protein
MATVGVATTAVAQSVDAAAAYLSLILTPAGGLPPHVTGSTIPSQSSGYDISIRYGQRAGSTSSQNIGFGIEVGAEEARFGGTVGFAGCSGCDDTIMLDVGYSTALLGAPAPTDGPTISARLAGSSGLGVQLDGDVVVVSTTVSLPVLLAIPVASRTDAPAITLFAIPGVSYGNLTCGDDCSASGFRASIGGGVGLLRAGRIDATVGASKVFIENGKTLVGVTLSWRSAP